VCSPGTSVHVHKEWGLHHRGLSAREENHPMRQPRWLFTILGALLAMISVIIPAWAGKLIVIANDGRSIYRRL